MQGIVQLIIFKYVLRISWKLNVKTTKLLAEIWHGAIWVLVLKFVKQAEILHGWIMETVFAITKSSWIIRQKFRPSNNVISMDN